MLHIRNDGFFSVCKHLNPVYGWWCRFLNMTENEQKKKPKGKWQRSVQFRWKWMLFDLSKWILSNVCWAHKPDIHLLVNRWCHKLTTENGRPNKFTKQYFVQCATNTGKIKRNQIELNLTKTIKLLVEFYAILVRLFAPKRTEFFQLNMKIVFWFSSSWHVM